MNTCPRLTCTLSILVAAFCLAVSATGGKGVISGIAPGHAAEIADLVRSRSPGETAAP